MFKIVVKICTSSVSGGSRVETASMYIMVFVRKRRRGNEPPPGAGGPTRRFRLVRNQVTRSRKYVTGMRKGERDKHISPSSGIYISVNVLGFGAVTRSGHPSGSFSGCFGV